VRRDSDIGFGREPGLVGLQRRLGLAGQPVGFRQGFKQELVGRDQDGRWRLPRQATALPGEQGELLLTLPRRALEPRGIAAGDVIHARNRPYGLEFARANGAQAREAFFLVLADDWHRELDPQPVKL
jgi:hypothetical protein